MKRLLFLSFWWLALPHLFAFLMSGSKALIRQDLDAWLPRHRAGMTRCCGFFCKLFPETLSLLLYLLLFRPEYRNVFYKRIGWPKLLLYYLPPLSTLYINTPNQAIEGGLYVEHGFSTIINARHIGRCCSISQQVTIGSSKSRSIGTGEPYIGDHVAIYAGSIVIGNIHVGSHCIIGAGSTVVRDLPDNVTVTPSAVVIHSASNTH